MDKNNQKWLGEAMVHETLDGSVHVRCEAFGITEADAIGGVKLLKTRLIGDRECIIRNDVESGRADEVMAPFEFFARARFSVKA